MLSRFCKSYSSSEGLDIVPVAVSCKTIRWLMLYIKELNEKLHLNLMNLIFLISFHFFFDLTIWQKAGSCFFPFLLSSPISFNKKYRCFVLLHNTNLLQLQLPFFCENKNNPFFYKNKIKQIFAINRVTIFKLWLFQKKLLRLLIRIFKNSKGKQFHETENLLKRYNICLFLVFWLLRTIDFHEIKIVEGHNIHFATI